MHPCLPGKGEPVSENGEAVACSVAWDQSCETAPQRWHNDLANYNLVK